MIKENMKGSGLFLQVVHNCSEVGCTYNWFTHEMKSAVLRICSYMMFLQLVHSWKRSLLFLQLVHTWKWSAVLTIG